MKKSTRRYPVVQVDTAAVGAVAHAGGVLLTHTTEATGLPAALSEQLAPWRKPLAVHDPAKVLTDLALSLVLGGDALCDAALLRAEPGLYGLVGSEATISRTIATLAEDADKALRAIATARAAARGVAWDLAGERSPGHGACPGDPIVVDLDATLITAHSDKESAEPTFKKGYGHHPLCAFVDHGPEGTGEPLALRLRPGRAGSNTAADHIGVTREAFKQLPGINPSRPGKKVLIRADGAGGTKDFTRWLTDRRVQYSVGFTLPFHTPDLLKQIPEQVWTPAYDADGAGPARCVRGRAERPAGPDVLAAGDASHRPQGNPPPRRPAEVHRHRRQTGHRVRDQHPPRAVGRPGTAPPAPRQV